MGKREREGEREREREREREKIASLVEDSPLRIVSVSVRLPR